jgi:hypothetical protein
MLGFCLQHAYYALSASEKFDEAEQVIRRCVNLFEKPDKQDVSPTEREILVVSLVLLSDFYSNPPEPRFANPTEALRLARRAIELSPEDGFARSSLRGAKYRTGDWQGCVAIRFADEGDEGFTSESFFAAMAYWQLGQKAKARAVFDVGDKNVKSREHWEPHVYPFVSWDRRLRAEAAALLGVDMPHVEAKAKSALKPAHPAK